MLTVCTPASWHKLKRLLSYHMDYDYEVFVCLVGRRERHIIHKGSCHIYIYASLQICRVYTFRKIHVYAYSSQPHAQKGRESTRAREGSWSGLGNIHALRGLCS